MNEQECKNILKELENCKFSLKFEKLYSNDKCKKNRSQCEYAIGRSIFWDELCRDDWENIQKKYTSTQIRHGKF